MLVSTKKLLTGVTVASALSMSAWSQAAQGQAQQAQPAQGQPAQGQAPAAGGQAQPQKQVKDQGEYDLFNAVTKETDPNKKLALLNQWKEKYPNTDFKKERQLYFLDTYRALNQADKVIVQAKEILADDPKEFSAMYWLALIIPSLPNAGANAEYVALADKAGRGMLENVGTAFAPEKKPATTNDAAWKKAQTEVEAHAYKAIGWAAMVNKNAAGAKENFTKALQANPATGEVSYWLGLTIVGEKDPTSYPTGLFHIARAAAYDGPGALPPAGRTQVNDYLVKAYKGFHGDESGLDQVKAQAKANALPPSDFKIASVKEIAENKLKAEEEAAKNDPKGAFWKRLKEGLTGPSSAEFVASVKGAALEPMRGKVVSHNTKTIQLAMSPGATEPEVTLEVMDAPLSGKAEPGTVLEFEGAVGKEFTPSPFMLTLEIEKAKISGWPAAPAKKPAARKPKRR